MKKTTKNNRAEVPTLFLVIGVLILCVFIFVNLTIFSLNSNKYAKLEEISEMEACLSAIEQYHFYNNLGYSLDKIKAIPNFQEQRISIEPGKLICNLDGIKITYPLK